eukprot:gnl/Chilomastix_cuspidata/4392.p1 GENE.gnl/Chilomastix_cuspidata/4392~~gnl/Chilomastix_cuspidata/4392.p1  ORF type:complete len:2288 (+),score=411.77 gnl/Chilomastix_cuspidata/4392:831-7694(+)
MDQAANLDKFMSAADIPESDRQGLIAGVCKQIRDMAHKIPKDTPSTEQKQLLQNNMFLFQDAHAAISSLGARGQEDLPPCFLFQIIARVSKLRYAVPSTSPLASLDAETRRMLINQLLSLVASALAAEPPRRAAPESAGASEAPEESPAVADAPTGQAVALAAAQAVEALFYVVPFCQAFVRHELAPPQTAVGDTSGIASATRLLGFLQLSGALGAHEEEFLVTVGSCVSLVLFAAPDSVAFPAAAARCSLTEVLEQELRGIAATADLSAPSAFLKASLLLRLAAQAAGACDHPAGPKPFKILPNFPVLCAPRRFSLPLFPIPFPFCALLATVERASALPEHVGARQFLSDALFFFVAFQPLVGAPQEFSVIVGTALPRSAFVRCIEAVVDGLHESMAHTPQPKQGVRAIVALLSRVALREVLSFSRDTFSVFLPAMRYIAECVDDTDDTPDEFRRAAAEAHEALLPHPAILVASGAHSTVLRWTEANRAEWGLHEWRTALFPLEMAITSLARSPFGSEIAKQLHDDVASALTAELVRRSSPPRPNHAALALFTGVRCALAGMACAPAHALRIIVTVGISEAVLAAALEMSDKARTSLDLCVGPSSAEITRKLSDNTQSPSPLFAAFEFLAEVIAENQAVSARMLATHIAGLTTCARALISHRDLGAASVALDLVTTVHVHPTALVDADTSQGHPFGAFIGLLCEILSGNTSILLPALERKVLGIAEILADRNIGDGALPQKLAQALLRYAARMASDEATPVAVRALKIACRLLTHPGVDATVMTEAVFATKDAEPLSNFSIGVAHALAEVIQTHRTEPVVARNAAEMLLRACMNHTRFDDIWATSLDAFFVAVREDSEQPSKPGALNVPAFVSFLDILLDSSSLLATLMDSIVHESVPMDIIPRICALLSWAIFRNPDPGVTHACLMRTAERVAALDPKETKRSPKVDALISAVTVPFFMQAPRYAIPVSRISRKSPTFSCYSRIPTAGLQAADAGYTLFLTVAPLALPSHRRMPLLAITSCKGSKVLGAEPRQESILESIILSFVGGKRDGVNAYWLEVEFFTGGSHTTVRLPFSDVGDTLRLPDHFHAPMHSQLALRYLSPFSVTAVTVPCFHTISVTHSPSELSVFVDGVPIVSTRKARGETRRSEAEPPSIPTFPKMFSSSGDGQVVYFAVIPRHSMRPKTRDPSETLSFHAFAGIIGCAGCLARALTPAAHKLLQNASVENVLSNNAGEVIALFDARRRFVRSRELLSALLDNVSERERAAVLFTSSHERGTITALGSAQVQYMPCFVLTRAHIDFVKSFPTLFSAKPVAFQSRAAAYLSAALALSSAESRAVRSATSTVPVPDAPPTPNLPVLHEAVLRLMDTPRTSLLAFRLLCLNWPAVDCVQGPPDGADAEPVTRWADRFADLPSEVCFATRLNVLAEGHGHKMRHFFGSRVFPKLCAADKAVGDGPAHASFRRRLFRVLFSSLLFRQAAMGGRISVCTDLEMWEFVFFCIKRFCSSSNELLHTLRLFSEVAAQHPALARQLATTQAVSETAGPFLATLGIACVPDSERAAHSPAFFLLWATELGINGLLGAQLRAGAEARPGQAAAAIWKTKLPLLYTHVVVKSHNDIFLVELLLRLLQEAPAGADKPHRTRAAIRAAIYMALLEVYAITHSKQKRQMRFARKILGSGFFRMVPYLHSATLSGVRNCREIVLLTRFVGRMLNTLGDAEGSDARGGQLEQATGEMAAPFSQKRIGRGAGVDWASGFFPLALQNASSPPSSGAAPDTLANRPDVDARVVREWLSITFPHKGADHGSHPCVLEPALLALSLLPHVPPASAVKATDEVVGAIASFLPALEDSEGKLVPRTAAHPLPTALLNRLVRVCAQVVELHGVPAADTDGLARAPFRLEACAELLGRFSSPDAEIPKRVVPTLVQTCVAAAVARALIASLCLSGPPAPDLIEFRSHAAPEFGRGVSPLERSVRAAGVSFQLFLHAVVASVLAELEALLKACRLVELPVHNLVAALPRLLFNDGVPPPCAPGLAQCLGAEAPHISRMCACVSRIIELCRAHYPTVPFAQLFALRVRLFAMLALRTSPDAPPAHDALPPALAAHASLLSDSVRAQLVHDRFIPLCLRYVCLPSRPGAPADAEKASVVFFLGFALATDDAARRELGAAVGGASVLERILPNSLGGHDPQTFAPRFVSWLFEEPQTHVRQAILTRCAMALDDRAAALAADRALAERRFRKAPHTPPPCFFVDAGSQPVAPPPPPATSRLAPLSREEEAAIAAARAAGLDFR